MSNTIFASKYFIVAQWEPQMWASQYSDTIERSRVERGSIKHKVVILPGGDEWQSEEVP